MTTLKGIGVSSGCAVGRITLLVHGRGAGDVKAAADPQGELCRFRRALESTARELDAIYERALRTLGGEEAEIFAVGDQTFLGKISREVQQETRESPLKVRLTKLAKQISIFGYISAAMVAFAYLFNTLVIIYTKIY